jgi:hypothetical protein
MLISRCFFGWAHRQGAADRRHRFQKASSTDLHCFFAPPSFIFVLSLQSFGDL